MRYPMIKKQLRREVNVPELSGGINLRDSLTGVRDNQMTDCINMWYKDGMLRTRPPFVSNEDMKYIKSTVYDKSYIGNVKTHTDIKNGEAILVSALQFDGYYSDYRWDVHILFWWQYDNKIEDAGSIRITLDSFVCENEESLWEALKIYSYFAFSKDGVAYCYASNGEDFYISKLDYINGADEWEYIENTKLYAPTVYVHCLRTGWDDFKGTQFEGYNLIGNSYKMIYSAYNEADSDKTHPMRYALAQKLPCDKGTIKVSITSCIKGDDVTNEKETEIITTEHIIEYDSEDYNNFSQGKIVIEKFGDGMTSQDGLRLFVKYNYVGFVMASEDDGDADKVFVVATLDNDEKVKKYACNEDNIVITAQYNMTDDWKKVLGMTRSVWFGGAAKGISGGSRLFLCGNKQDKEKSLVVWSGLNNPLYFSENNYAYVGDKSQSVTTFGRQGENLIIFKERSTYYSYYAVNENITADSLTSQTIVDYEANSVYFPMMQLNGSIGCDCPDTVQLCRNRLMWANSDGNVYTLYSNNQYSERTIYKVSDMIYSVLSKENDLKSAISCDFEGHYLLGVGNKIYVMDYNSYGYQYASSFTKTEDSNTQIPWYVWSVYGNNGVLYELNNRLILVSNFQISGGVALAFSMLSLNDSGYCDCMLNYDSATNELTLINNKINSKFQTKLFDFSSRGYSKNIDRVSVGFGNNGGEPINVSFLTNVGSTSEIVTLDGFSTNERDAAFVTVKSLYPTLKAIHTLGVKFECEGPLIVDGISLQYRLLGGAK